VSSLVGLVLVGNLDCIIGHSAGFLGQHAKRHKFAVAWRRKGMCNMILLTFVWSSKAVGSVLKLFISETSMTSFDVCRCFVGICQSGLFLVIVHSVCHALTFLELMLDAYTTEFHDRDAWARAVKAWNVVQALLHNLSRRVDSCFLAVQTSATIAFLCYAARILDSIITKSTGKHMDQFMLAVLELPSLMMVLGAFVLFVKAAGVTEACVRVPPVMNSVGVDVDNPINHDRQYLVSFISNSHAGFRIKGNRVDATLLMNYCYLCGAVVCGLFTTGLSMSRKQ